jgi:hypothetical protein
MTDVFAEELLKNPLLIDKDYKEVFPKIMARAITIYKTQ